MFVFRNHTVERFFPKGYTFSGYDDISFIPQDAEGYVWFYQVPVKNDRKLLAEEVENYSGKVEYLLGQIDPSKAFVALTLVPVFEPVVSESDFQLAAAIAGFNLALYRLAQEHVVRRVEEIAPRELLVNLIQRLLAGVGAIRGLIPYLQR